MQRLLNKLPRKRKDAATDQRQVSQPHDPTNAASPPTRTGSYDSDDNNSTDPTSSAGDDSTGPAQTAINGRSNPAQSKDGSNSKRHSLFSNRANHKRHSQQSQNNEHNPRLSQHSKDDAHHNRKSTSDEPRRRHSALISYDQPVDEAPIQDTDTNKSTVWATRHSLQLGPQDTNLYDDLRYLTQGGDSRDAVVPSRKRYSEDVADRNAMLNEKGGLHENTAGRRGSILRAPQQVDEFSEDVADRNLDSPARSSSRKASAASTPRKPKPNQVLGHQINADSGYLGQLESCDSSASNQVAMAEPGTQEDSRQELAVPHVKTMNGAPKTNFEDLDFNDSEDVDFHTRYAPAVTHETVIPEIHHVEHKVVTREIHNHDVYHRILPIKDVEVLPAKHFVRDPVTGNLTQIPAPVGREGEHQPWKIVSADSDSAQPSAPRVFTARTFGKDEGMPREYMGEDGVPRTEVTWVHPPAVEDGGYKTGQTEALFIDESNGRKSTGKTHRSAGWLDGVHDTDSRPLVGA